MVKTTTTPPVNEKKTIDKTNKLRKEDKIKFIIVYMDFSHLQGVNDHQHMEKEKKKGFALVPPEFYILTTVVHESTSC